MQTAATPGRLADESDVVRNLAAAAGWMRFMAILGFVAVGLMGLVGAGVMLIGIPEAGPVGRLVGLLYLAIAGVYLIPVLPLNKAAGLAEGLRAAPSYQVAADSLRYQVSFWRRMGILSIVGIAFSVVAFVIGFMAAGPGR